MHMTWDVPLGGPSSEGEFYPPCFSMIRLSRQLHEASSGKDLMDFADKFLQRRTKSLKKNPDEFIPERGGSYPSCP